MRMEGLVLIFYRSDALEVVQAVLKPCQKMSNAGKTALNEFQIHYLMLATFRGHRTLNVARGPQTLNREAKMRKEQNVYREGHKRLQVRF